MAVRVANILLRFSFVFILVAAVTGCQRNQSNTPQHVFLIVIDTLRADHLGCYGYQRPTSPTIDRLARQSVLCTRSYATSTNTLQSVVGLLTSSVDLTGHDYQNGLSADRPYLPAVMSQASYNTFAVVANPWLAYFKDSLTRGFDDYNFVFDTSWEVPGIMNSTDRVTQEVLKLFDTKISWQERNFVYIHYLDPHDPYRPPAEDSFVAGRLPAEPLFVHTVSGEEDVRMKYEKDPTNADFPQPVPVSADVVQYFTDQYDGEIKHVDRAIGKLLAQLQRLAVLEDSLIVVTADHGEEFLEHGCFKHGFHLYKETISVPLIFYGPQWLRRKQLATPVSGIDVAPTILGLCRIRPPAGMQGHNIFDPDYREQPILFCTHFVNQQKAGMKLYPWKIIRNERNKTTRLYNVAADPSEKNDLLAQGDDRPYRALLTTFEAELHKHALMSRSNQNQLPAMDNRTRTQLKALGYLD
jgi:arylsulfatase